MKSGIKNKSRKPDKKEEIENPCDNMHTENATLYETEDASEEQAMPLDDETETQ